MADGTEVIGIAADGEQVVSLYGAAQLGIASFKTLQKWEERRLLGMVYTSEGWPGRRYLLKRIREVAGWGISEEQAS